MAAKKDPRAVIHEVLREHDEEHRAKAQQQKPKKPRARRVPNLHIVGNGNVQAGGNINFTTEKVVHKVVVQTGVGTVTASEKAELKRLKDEWVEVHNAIKKSPLTHGAAWGRFYKHFKVNSYSELHSEQFNEACSWFKRQIAMLRRMPTAKRKDPSWRSSKIRYVKVVCKNDLGHERAYDPYILERFGKTSLADLTDLELEATYAYIAGLKSKMKRT